MVADGPTAHTLSVSVYDTEKTSFINLRCRLRSPAASAAAVEEDAPVITAVTAVCDISLPHAQVNEV